MEDGGTGACPSNAPSAKITSDLLEAYLKCPTICWLLAIARTDTGHPYSEWVKSQSEFFRAAEPERLLAGTPEG